MRSRVELFEQIRRDRDREALSIHQLARRHGVHRRTVRQALEAADGARPRQGSESSSVGFWTTSERATARRKTARSGRTEELGELRRTDQGLVAVTEERPSFPPRARPR